MDAPNNLIIFDGICNFCNAAINFIIKRDTHAKFSFTTVQSKTGSRLLNDLDIDPNDPNTFVLIKNGSVFLKSNAALEISKELIKPWSWAAHLTLIPVFIRDPAYSLIARNRYKLMGKKESCMIPTPDIKTRFID